MHTPVTTLLVHGLPSHVCNWSRSAEAHAQYAVNTEAVASAGSVGKCSGQNWSCLHSGSASGVAWRSALPLHKWRNLASVVVQSICCSVSCPRYAALHPSLRSQPSFVAVSVSQAWGMQFRHSKTRYICSSTCAVPQGSICMQYLQA